MSSSTGTSRRHLLLIGFVFAFIVLIFGSTLLTPGQTLAQDDQPAAAKSAGLPKGLAVPEPLSPAIATPDPNQVVPAATGGKGSSDLEVVQFRPQIRLQRGQPSPALLGVSKPAGSSHAPAQKSGPSGPTEPYQAPDLDSILSPQGWTLQLYEGFEGAFPGTNWIIEDFGDDCYYDVISGTVCLFLDRSWGDTDYYSYFGNWSAWPAAGGADKLDPNFDWYSDGLNSWMEYEFDFSNMSDVFVNFGLYLDTEPNWDWMYFCTSIDFQNYDCDYWSGYSGGWEDQTYWLTSYAGYSQVWLAWVFESDDSISQFYEGPFVDEVEVWGFDASAPPPPTPTPDPLGELVLNGSFETGDLTDWQSNPSVIGSLPQLPAGQRPSLNGTVLDNGSSTQPASPPEPDSVSAIGVSNATYVEGIYSAYLWQPDIGDDFLYQTMSVPPQATDIVLNFWFAVTTYEMNPRIDWFCGSLADPADHANILVDLGCMDAFYTTGTWQEVLYALSDSEVSALAGKDVDLVFELYNRDPQVQGGTGTAAWIDYVRLYATGSGAGAGLDPYEPNDSPQNATSIRCGETLSGVIGDAFSSYDEDWFVVSGVSLPLDIDIDARTNVNNPSTLDSMLTLYDNNLSFLDFNDDDGFSYDSFIHFTTTLPINSYFIQVESYTGYGGPDHTYDLTVRCGGGGQGTPPNDNPQPGNREWTVMLYLNAEDPAFQATLQGYLTSIEAFIGSKSGFLDVVALYDGPGGGDTVRYHVQPNGNYTDGVNRWPRGEMNMGDPDTLAGFVGWAMDLFPAHNYYLAIDDHGHGVYGISWDQTNGNDQLTPPEVYSALKDATNNGARKIDIFDYEACLMGMAENAYDVSQWVDYVVFFEQISWGLDTYPNYFSGLQPGDTPVPVGTNIIDTYYNLATSAGYPHTISLINTRGMPAVKQASTQLADALSQNYAGDANRKAAVNAARDVSQAFAADNDATNPVLADYIDLWDLADQAQLSGLISPTLELAVQTAVDNAVVHEQHYSDSVGSYYWDHSGAHGLSIYYPAFNGSNAFNEYINERLFQMNQDESGILGHWDEFLLWAVTQGGNGPGGSGGGDRKGMFGFRFLQPRLGGDQTVYLPAIVR